MAVKIQVESLSKEYQEKLRGRTLTKGTIDRLATEISRKYLLQRKAFRRTAVFYAVIVVLLGLMTLLSPSAPEGSAKAILISLGFVAAVGIILFAVIYYAVVTRVPRQFAKCLKEGYPELEMLYGYDMIVSGSAAAGRPSQQMPFS